MPERLTAEGLIRIPSGLVLFVGMADLAPGARGEMDAEHDALRLVAARPGRLARRGRPAAAR